MRALEVVGPTRGASGYDRHTREFVREFVRAGVQVQLTQLSGWPADLPAPQRERWLDELARPVQAGAALHFAMPSQVQPRAGRVDVNYTMFEADRIPPAWAACAAPLRRIVVPTRSSYAAWRAGGVPEAQLRLCPLGVDAAFFGAPAPPLPVRDRTGRAVLGYRHRFLNVADLRPRKNHLGLLRAWMLATRAEDDAVLLLKVPEAPQALAALRAELARAEARLGRRLDAAAPVVFVAGLLDDAALRSLYRSATHYVSMSCGEGWDLPMMEAGVAGLALLAPRHSAYLDTLRDGEALAIPARREPARFEGGLAPADQALFDGACWWRPDEEAAAALIRGVISGQAPAPAPPAARWRDDYRWAGAARRLLELLDE